MKNIVQFTLKKAIGKLSAGRGRLIYDRNEECLQIFPNYSGDDAQLITEPESTQQIRLPQKAISRIHFQKALLFGGGDIVVRLRGGAKSDWHPFFKCDEWRLPISKRHVEQAEELVREVKFDLFEDTLDDMLEETDEALGY